MWVNYCLYIHKLHIFFCLIHICSLFVSQCTSVLCTFTLASAPEPCSLFNVIDMLSLASLTGLLYVCTESFEVQPFQGSIWVVWCIFYILIIEPAMSTGTFKLLDIILHTFILIYALISTSTVVFLKYSLVFIFTAVF